MTINKRAGTTTQLVVGAGGLVILVVIMLVVISTVLNANLLRSTAQTTTQTDTGAWINATTYTLDNFDARNRAYAISSIVNQTGTVTIIAGNYTFDSTAGTIVNASVTNWGNVNITYTYITPTDEEDATNNLNSNFTGGIDKISAKIPTIFLIAAVVLLMGVLIYLWIIARNSGIVGGGGGNASL